MTRACDRQVYDDARNERFAVESCVARIVALLVFVTGPASHLAAAPVDNRLLTSEPSGANWAAFGRVFDEQRFSPLTQVNAKTVHRLGLAWSLDLDVNNSATQPLEVDGIIYFAAGLAVVHAVDARTGKLLWRFDPDVPAHAGDKLRGGWGSRGIAYWLGKVYVGTQDGRLIAIDATHRQAGVERADRRSEGRPLHHRRASRLQRQGDHRSRWRRLRTGSRLRHGIRRDDRRASLALLHRTGRSRAGLQNKAMEMAAKTWNGQWWKFGGGGTVWNAMTYDPEFNRIYLGTGNGFPWNQRIRSPGGGDNLFMCSVVALNADTGEYVWHYQTTPGEAWDYNSSMDMVLATLEIDGKPRKVLLHAPKNGFFYVLDRENGKLISAEKIGKVTWAERVDLKTGRPVEVPGARYEHGGVLLWPSPSGVHNWPPDVIQSADRPRVRTDDRAAGLLLRRGYRRRALAALCAHGPQSWRPERQRRCTR